MKGTLNKLVGGFSFLTPRLEMFLEVYTNKIGSVILARHVNATTIICINDPYDYAESIKDDERELRIQGQGPIPNVYMKPDDLFPRPANSRQFSAVLATRNTSRL